MKKRAFLLLGTNLGDRTAKLNQAIEAIDQQVGKIVKTSSVFETSAWGKTDQPAFLNQAIEIYTKLGPEELLTHILSIEEQLGRKRLEHWGERSIDIDILFFGKEIYASPRLAIPHPQLENRRFTLIPLNEIAPHFIHPLLKKTVGDLLAECPDTLSVKKYSDTRQA
jgi:2-amino-4-hydroxy-6-hydroxymethyldihydropteridine diphosphokinase